MKKFISELRKLMTEHGVDLSMIDAGELNAMFVMQKTQEDFDIRHLLPDEYKERISNLDYLEVGS